MLINFAIGNEQNIGYILAKNQWDMVCTDLKYAHPYPLPP